MIDANRPMEMNFEADYAGVDARTYAAAVECVRKEKEISRAVAIVLLKHFAGYPWEIKTEMEREAAMVRLPLMPPNFYYILPFKKFMTGPSVMEKVVMKAGGELLERFNLSRKGIDFAEYEAAKPRPVLVDGEGPKAKPKLHLPN